MEIAIPTAPVAIITLLGFLSPYIIAIVNQPFWSTTQRKVVGVLGSLVLAAIALLIYYAASGEPLPQWWALLLLALVVSQASYALVTKSTALKLEKATSKPIDAGTPGDGPSNITDLE
jgi:hypothetical protein